MSAKRMRLALDPAVYAFLNLETGETFLAMPDGLSPGPDYFETSRLVRHPAGTVHATFAEELRVLPHGSGAKGARG